MSVKQVLQLESDSVTDRPVTIPFEFTRLESLPEGKTVGDSIVIRPATVRTYFRIKPLLLQIEQQDRDALVADKPVGFSNRAEAVMSKYSEIVFEIVCLGIHNKRGEYAGLVPGGLERQLHMGRYLYPAERHLIPYRMQPFYQYYHSAKSCEPVKRSGDNSPSGKQRDMAEGVRSNFMFLVTCNEAFGYTHEQTLDSGMSILLGMLQEYGYIQNKRSRALRAVDTEEEEPEGEWIEVTDFETGKVKRVKKVYSL